MSRLPLHTPEVLIITQLSLKAPQGIVKIGFAQLYKPKHP
jgi:hypothetical protein